MELKISLTGDLGSGKSTVSDLIVRLTGAEYYSTGRICRAIADKHGIDVVAMNRYMETHPEIDKEIDDGIAALSDVDRKMIIDSRMAWHFVRDTFRLYLSVDPDVSAARIFAAGRSTENFSTVEETAKKIAERKESEKRRYLDLYHVDYTDLSNYSLVVDTTYATPTEVAELVLSVAEEWERDHKIKRAYICPSRLYYPEEGAPLDYVHDLACRLDLAEEIPPVTVVEDNGKFYVTEGTPSALAYSLNDAVFVPCLLKKGKKNDGDYVQIKNSL